VVLSGGRYRQFQVPSCAPLSLGACPPIGIPYRRGRAVSIRALLSAVGYQPLLLVAAWGKPSAVVDLLLVVVAAWGRPATRGSL